MEFALRGPRAAHFTSCRMCTNLWSLQSPLYLAQHGLFSRPQVRPGPSPPSSSSVSVASAVSEWEQRVPQSTRQASLSPPSSRNRMQEPGRVRTPKHLVRRRGRCWTDSEVPIQPSDVDFEDLGQRVSASVL